MKYAMKYAIYPVMVLMVGLELGGLGDRPGLSLSQASQHLAPPTLIQSEISLLKSQSENRSETPMDLPGRRSGAGTR